jgi:hypothetical protein
MELVNIKTEKEYNEFYKKLNGKENCGKKDYRGYWIPNNWRDFLKTDIAKRMGLKNIDNISKPAIHDRHQENVNRHQENKDKHSFFGKDKNKDSEK